MPTNQPAIAYFSMEIALEPGIPTYAGGLGILAGDILRSAADLSVPMVGVTLVSRQGYFHQELDAEGSQTEHSQSWSPEDVLEPNSTVVSVQIGEREVKIRPWIYRLTGVTGSTLPVLLLDTSLPHNHPEDQALTDHLYGGDQGYRIRQEAVLGLGGVAVLKELGYDSNLIYHMNEGHSSLLALALLERRLEEGGGGQIADGQIEAVRHQCVFTTHTPVPAGHDQFPRDLATQVLGADRMAKLEASGCLLDGVLNMTFVALRFSRYINGVSMTHGEVSVGMFPEYPVQAITNGVHAATWIAPPLAELYDRYMPRWRLDNRYLRYAIGMPLQGIREAHQAAKRALLDQIERRIGIRLRDDVFTIAFARRATAYKRADLLLARPERLNEIARRVGSIQVVYGGKAHPHDGSGKEMIRRVFSAAKELGDAVKVVYLPDYDMELAGIMIAGCDLWLNTPRRPREASGTSGMKAACNGVPSLSVLDGWWVEGHIEGVTGWSIPHGRTTPDNESEEISALYDKLERVILPFYYGQRPAYDEVMRSAIALNGSFFTTQRVVSQYLRNAYCVPTEVGDVCWSGG